MILPLILRQILQHPGQHPARDPEQLGDLRAGGGGPALPHDPHLRGARRPAGRSRRTALLRPRGDQEHLRDRLLPPLQHWEEGDEDWKLSLIFNESREVLG